MLNRLVALILFFALVGSYACFDDVPHENPLDPHNTENRLTIDGTVQTYYPPRRPIANAIVTIQPGNRRIFSNQEGYFIFTDILSDDYTVYATAEGYHQDSIQITIDGTETSLDFELDGLPYFKNIAMTTHHVSRHFPIDEMYSLQIDATVDDNDGIADINQVSFAIPEFNQTSILDATQDFGVFSKTLSIEEVPVSSIHALIGRQFILNVTDDVGITVSSDAQFLTRVIDLTPQLEFPIELDTVATTQNVFRWERVHLNYPFICKLEIFQINIGNLVKVKEYTNIPADERSIVIDYEFSRGNYLWILTIIDEFGNTSSSKEGTFHVE
ncbi:MAG: carboxypeptidase regulatory-like domain-containing protein [Calditrichaeota bacterium]|nr:MAG: carboxypeptidase regulatory-like domain-containing protein [Calditrichota bacterium]